ncbi:Pseudouridylate synthase 3 [Lasiodiplodia theobromae]|uniref:tRNA pseudouridine(38/39) synthase n=1 Tax=Lasiodiplodia theobromae TaxID=45133 RepID=A0A5N5DKW9_9PEZI|nr:Pseudouridylate synthase 3 [Lasiodiplodia theobromae]KAB2577532.1 tRNA pseudouridine(38/39) synthase [Lasiodiplodia theobromae]KAF4535502.1 Pseudouridylate synthase 3 [Lasiodiplodia theobromae]
MTAPLTMNTTAWTDDEFVARRAEIEQRLARVTELEHKLAQQNATYTSPTASQPTTTPAPTKPAPPAGPAKKPRGAPKPFDPSKYTTRLVALKFAYLGSNYNGYEHHANNTTPLPTIEEELWKALKKTRLILPTPKAGLKEDDINWEGCEYSKCGRTDRGVSAFGQVIGIRVRSNRPKPKPKKKLKLEDGTAAQEGSADAMEGVETGAAGAPEEVEEYEDPPFDDIKDEMPYCRVLNNVLPPDIRVLAWCPSPGEGFSARFNCKERRYKYFFTNPAFAPTPGPAGVYNGGERSMREGWLDIAAMREAASYLEGLHDFRNFCKVDPAKQITNFERRIFHTSIDRWNGGSGFAKYAQNPQFQIPGLGAEDRGAVVLGGGDDHDENGPGLFTFNVHGSAFLWHQVRHLIAVLFLVGQGLEKPTIVKELLDVQKNPTKPKYEMATDTPLVLWDCVFPAEQEGHPEQSQPDALNWIYVGDERAFKGPRGNGLEEKFGHGGVIPDLWEVWHRRRIDEVLAGSLLDLVAAQGPQDGSEEGTVVKTGKGLRSSRLFDGGDTPRLMGQYVPVMKKERMEPVDVINARYLERKGLDKKAVAARQEDADE